MLLGMTQVIFEGVPTYPDASRAWAITDKYKVPKLHIALANMPSWFYNASMQLTVPKMTSATATVRL